MPDPYRGTHARNPNQDNLKGEPVQRRRIFTVLFAAAAGLLVCLSCDSSDYNSPEPSSLETHQHTVLIRFRSVNQASDSFGIGSAVSASSSFLASRDAGGKLTRHSVDPGYLGQSIQFLYPDSEVHTCTALVSHFIGYQRAYGIDTLRYGAMDQYGSWDMWLTFDGNEFVTAAGETLPSDNIYLRPIPDSTRQNGLWELDVTFDLGGLLTWNQTRTRLVVHTDRISVRQR